MVFWAAAAPSAKSADSLIGGWEPVGAGECCNGWDTPPCSEGEYNGVNQGCQGGDTRVCTQEWDAGFECNPMATNSCSDGTGDDSWICTDLMDTTCDSG